MWNLAFGTNALYRTVCVGQREKALYRKRGAPAPPILEAIQKGGDAYTALALQLFPLLEASG
jgi:hypothetical protein